MISDFVFLMALFFWMFVVFIMLRGFDAVFKFFFNFSFLEWIGERLLKW